LRSDSVTSVQTTGRYEETAHHRHELEAVKRENEALKRRIRELERMLSRTSRQGDPSRTRSESVSTTASVRDNTTGVLLGRERENEADDEVVRVGESARSTGVLR
jgi:predicted  nucleic acid-binding Zn-ribbon protein